MLSSLITFKNKEFNIRFNNQLIVDLILLQLVCVLQFYPSFLLFDQATVILRSTVAIFIAGFLLLFKVVLNYAFVKKKSIGIALRFPLWEALLPAGLALVSMALHGPYWFASPSFFSDEIGIMKQVVFGQVFFFLRYKYVILAICILFHSFLFFSVVRRWFSWLIFSYWIIVFGLLVSFFWILGLEFFSTQKHTWASKYPPVKPVALIYGPLKAVC